MLEITVLNLPQPQKTKTFEITPRKKNNQECFIGRDNRCCVILDDMKISRIHGKIAFRNGTYYYTDLGSRNGSQINHKRVKAHQNYPLKSSDTIALGNHLIWIKAIADRLESPSSSDSVSSQQDPKEEKLKINCVQVIDETYNVKTFRFVADSPSLFKYKPGQFLTLHLNIGGKSVKRSYPISSTPSRPHTLDITLKLAHFLGEDNSPVSLVKKSPKSSEIPNTIAELVNNWLYKNLKVGSKITISQPMGKFPDFANSSQKLLLISAGIGIAPTISIARWLCDTVSNVDLTFVHSARSPRDLIFLKELELMAQRHPKFKLAITITRPETGMSWYGYTGRLNASILPAIAPDYQERNVYVFGSDSFRQSMKFLLQGLSFPMANYYEETLDISRTVKQNLPQVTSVAKVNPVNSQAKSLGIVAKANHNIKTKAIISSLTSTKVPASAIASSVKAVNSSVKSEPIKTKMPTVFFTKSGKKITCDGEKSILDHALAKGIDLPYGCGIGICGQCKLKKISGKVVYDDDDIPCEDSHVLTCIAKAEGKVILEERGTR